MSGRAIQVTIKLPEEIYQRVERTAGNGEQRIDDLLPILIAEGLDAHLSARELLERVSASYRERLAHHGELDQGTDRVLADLANLREQVASELYPQ